jgi:hypothetical protein
MTGRLAPWAAAAALALAACAAQAQEREVVHVMEHGDFLDSDSQTPPPDDAPWRPVTLPENWYAAHPASGSRVGWYRLPFELTEREPEAVHSLYLPRNSAKNIVFYLNGQPCRR